jgi:iterative type I PKS product template protein
LGDYLYGKFYPRTKRPGMDITNLVVTKGLIAQKGSTTTPQLIQVTAKTASIESGILDLTWQTVDCDGSASEPFATANIVFGESQQWLSSWSPMAHLVLHRIEMLETLAAQGKANRLSNNMAYTLFANNLVDYSEKYRGMQSVVMHDLEAFAEVQLSTKDDGAKFTVPPYFIDSVAHLAGFIMNCSDSIDTQQNYCVTSGWQSMRFAEPLTAGSRYRSYVKMIPTAEDSSVYLGDVYILRAEDNVVVGMVGGIHFRRFPRLLLSRFFSAPEVPREAEKEPTPAVKRGKVSILQAPVAAEKSTDWSTESNTSDSGFDEPHPVKSKKIALKPNTPVTIEVAMSEDMPSSAISVGTATSSEGIRTPPSGGTTVAGKALDLIARETALDLADLQDEAEFCNLGIDSLMSLVLAEKFRLELNVKVNGSLFLDYPTVGDLRRWLVEYYN